MRRKNNNPVHTQRPMYYVSCKKSVLRCKKAEIFNKHYTYVSKIGM